MSKNEIAVREHFLPSAFQNKNEAKIRVFVEYEKINDAEYAFISRPDQDTEIRIVPGAPGEEQGGTQTDPIHADAEKVFSAKYLDPQLTYLQQDQLFYHRIL